MTKGKRIAGLILIMLIAVFCVSCGSSEEELLNSISDIQIEEPDPENAYYSDITESYPAPDDYAEDYDAYDDYTEDDYASGEDYTGGDDYIAEDLSDPYREEPAADDMPSLYAEEPAYTGDPDIGDEQGVNTEGYDVPDGAAVVTYTGDKAQLIDDMYNETSKLPSEVYVAGGSFDSNDLFAMPYSGFWIKDYTTRTETGTDPLTGEATTYTICHFNYYDGLTVEELERQKAEVDSAADAIISRIPLGADTWTQIRVVHDEICRSVSYDYSISKPHIYDAFGALINREAVCNGYSCAFNHVMARLGIDAKRIYSAEHAWNYVNVPSEELFLDLTWDDTDMFDENGREYVKNEYLFLTLDEMRTISQHQDLNGEPDSDTGYSEPYNYCIHEGYCIYSYNWDDLVSIMRRQYETGTNMLTVRFDTDADYQMVKQWNASGRPELNDLLGQLGYTGKGYYTWYNDELRTLSIGLYAPKQ